MSPVMIAALMIGLRVKKETIGEITAAAQVMRELATRVEVADRTIWSTSSAPAATARTPSTSRPRRCSSPPRPARGSQARQPQRVVEVGQRRRAGGARRAIDLPPEQIAASIAETGIGFMFAPNHHSAMKNVGAGAQGARRAHPVQHPRAAHESRRRAEHLMGVFHPDLVGIQVACCSAWRRARAGRLRQGRHGRDLARRRDPGRRAQGRR